jgi:hypothetical protein
MSWLRRPLGKRKREEELEEEVRSHLEMVARDQRRRSIRRGESLGTWNW